VPQLLYEYEVHIRKHDAHDCYDKVMSGRARVGGCRHLTFQGT
jgi:hypothetical protein